MNTGKIIEKLYDRVAIVGESKMMKNRFYVLKANKLINKLIKYEQERAME